MSSLEDNLIKCAKFLAAGKGLISLKDGHTHVCVKIDNESYRLVERKTREGPVVYLASKYEWSPASAHSVDNGYESTLLGWIDQDLRQFHGFLASSDL